MTPTGHTRERQRALAVFFRAHQHDLERLVASRAHKIGPDAVLDACAFAWLTLVRRPDIVLERDSLRWLAAVGVHEAWRAKRELQEMPWGTFSANEVDDLEFSDRLGLVSDPLDLVLAAEVQRDRIARFARLKPRERRDLLLLAGGYKYHEIAAATASTYTAVNRRITEGRARLRRM